MLDAFFRQLDQIRVAWIARWKNAFSKSKSGDGWMALIEWSLIAIFALWVGRAYLDLDATTIPFGREIMMVIQSHNLWNVLKECGTCAFWNGSTSGGYPAFVQLFGAPLHPIVVITSLIWGVVNGTKVALILALWVAGVAQWWIARGLQVGWLPRMWTALTAVVGGHLAGRMEAGAFTILFSTAAASLVVGGILAVERRKDYRAVVCLAVVLASAILSGQGYMQIGIITSIPAMAFVLIDSRLTLRPIWKKYMLAALLAIMLAAPLLVPLIHFFPNFGKPADPEFKSAQPLEYLPLNLIVNDIEFYWTEQILDKIGAPAPYTLYIGWTAVILAILGMGLVRKTDRGKVAYLACGAFLVFLMASGVVLSKVSGLLPVAAVVRFPSFIAGLVVPFILGLSAYGLQRVMELDWPSLLIRAPEKNQSSALSFSMKWLVLIPLVINLRTGTTFARAWLTTSHQGDDVPWVLETLNTSDLQWVSPPFGEHYFITPAVSAGLKISPGLKPWGWKDRALPIPRLEALRGGPPASEVNLVDDEFGIFVYLHPEEYYAAVVQAGGQEPCVASGAGGEIQVACENTQPGRLVVKENTWSGWKAWRDGERVPLAGDQWLEVEAPAGQHTYQFRYVPWDVPAGLIVSILGLILCGWYWLKPTNRLKLD